MLVSLHQDRTQGPDTLRDTNVALNETSQFHLLTVKQIRDKNTQMCMNIYTHTYQTTHTTHTHINQTTHIHTTHTHTYTHTSYLHTHHIHIHTPDHTHTHATHIHTPYPTHTPYHTHASVHTTSSYIYPELSLVVCLVCVSGLKRSGSLPDSHVLRQEEPSRTGTLLQPGGPGDPRR